MAHPRPNWARWRRSAGLEDGFSTASDLSLVSFAPVVVPPRRDVHGDATSGAAHDALMGFRPVWSLVRGSDSIGANHEPESTEGLEDAAEPSAVDAPRYDEHEAAYEPLDAGEFTDASEFTERDARSGGASEPEGRAEGDVAGEPDAEAINKPYLDLDPDPEPYLDTTGSRARTLLGARETTDWRQVDVDTVHSPDEATEGPTEAVERIPAASAATMITWLASDDEPEADELLGPETAGQWTPVFAELAPAEGADEIVEPQAPRDPAAPDDPVERADFAAATELRSVVTIAETVTPPPAVAPSRNRPSAKQLALWVVAVAVIAIAVATALSGGSSKKSGGRAGRATSIPPVADHQARSSTKPAIPTNGPVEHHAVVVQPAHTAHRKGAAHATASTPSSTSTATSAPVSSASSPSPPSTPAPSTPATSTPSPSSESSGSVSVTPEGSSLPPQNAPTQGIGSGG